MGVRYQLILAKISSYINQAGKTASTVASQQYYHYPPGIVSVDAASITVGSVTYPVHPIYSQDAWNLLNALQIQPTAIPQFLFARRDDFGIWPIPQAVYTINFFAFQRDRNLSIADYATSTISVTQGSTTITGSGTTFTTAMVGRWFSVTDPTAPGQGYWYRVATFVSTTALTLESAYQGSTGSGYTYVIGETPELPEDAHMLMADGTAADYYSGFRNDAASATWWNNKFWTGDGNNNTRDINSKNVSSGLIGIIKNYENRDMKRLIRKQPQPFLPQYNVWATTIS